MSLVYCTSQHRHKQLNVSADVWHAVANTEHYLTTDTLTLTSGLGS